MLLNKYQILKLNNKWWNLVLQVYFEVTKLLHNLDIVLFDIYSFTPLRSNRGNS